MNSSTAIVDGNEPATWVAYRLNEIAAIYPMSSEGPLSRINNHSSDNAVVGDTRKTPALTILNLQRGTLSA